MPPAPVSSALTEPPSSAYLPVSNLISRGAVPAIAPGGVSTVAALFAGGNGKVPVCGGDGGGGGGNPCDPPLFKT